MKRIGKIAVLAATTLAAASCSLLDVEPTVIMKDTYYNTEQEVLHGLAGVYGVMNNEDFYGSNYSIICSLNDDLSYCRASSATYQIDFLEHGAGSIEVYNLWTAIYKGVKNANAFMNAMRDSDLDPDGFYYHEGRFMRAYYHFLLAQCWGDVPLLDFENTSAQKLHIAKTPQYDVLKWVIGEMDACLDYLPEALDNAPSRVTRTTAEGILARVCLFTAGATVDRGADSADDYYKKAMDYSWAVIDSGLHDLNPDYSDVFIRMISDKYDTQYRESMWEVEFKGNREDANNWTNGRIGELNKVLRAETTTSASATIPMRATTVRSICGTFIGRRTAPMTNRPRRRSRMCAKTGTCRRTIMPGRQSSDLTMIRMAGKPPARPVSTKRRMFTAALRLRLIPRSAEVCATAANFGGRPFMRGFAPLRAFTIRSISRFCVIRMFC